MIIKILLVLIGFSSGVIVAGGIFALITALGIVPRLVAKSKTDKHIPLYENCIIFGGIIGTILSFWTVSISLGKIALVLTGLFFGMFVGNLIVALAEFINVLPIMNRRLKIKGGIGFMIIALGIGKSLGSLLYWIIPGLI